MKDLNPYKSLCDIFSTHFDPNLYSLDDDFHPVSIPYGGGGAGIKNGHYGHKHSKETKELIAFVHRGKIPWNKGVENPIARERMLKQNPMKDKITKEKVRQKLIGRPAHNKITTEIILICEFCQKETKVFATAHNHRRFCGKSCAAKFRNKNYWSR